MEQKDRDSCAREAKILKILKHPFVVGYHDVYKTKSGKLYIIMDYCEKGDLDKEIKKRQRSFEASGGDPSFYFDDDLVMKWLAQLCLAMKQVHSFQIIHRDLKPANIFLDKDNNVKLADFGIARVLSSDKSRADSRIGTPAYMAPEIFEQKEYEMKVDVWSIGIILYQLHTLSLPFHSHTMSKVIQQVLTAKVDMDKIRSRQLKSIIKACLQKNPNDRPKFK